MCRRACPLPGALQAASRGKSLLGETQGTEAPFSSPQHSSRLSPSPCLYPSPLSQGPQREGSPHALASKPGNFMLRTQKVCTAGGRNKLFEPFPVGFLPGSPGEAASPDLPRTCREGVMRASEGWHHL